MHPYYEDNDENHSSLRKEKILMFGMRAKKVALLIGLIAVFLVVSIAVVFAIDVHAHTVTWNDRRIELLWFFLVGCLFFPGVLHRYRTLRQRERNIPWYRRFDLTLCLLALVSGLLFAIIVIQELTVEAIYASHRAVIDLGPGTMMIYIGSYQTNGLFGSNNLVNALTIALIVLDLCWLLLALFLLIQAISFLFTRLRHTPAIQEG